MGSVESQFSIVAPEVTVIEHDKVIYDDTKSKRIQRLNKFYIDDIYIHFIQFLEEYCDTSDPNNYVSYVEIASAFLEYMSDITDGITTTYEMKELLDALVKKLNTENLDVKIYIKGFPTAYEFMIYKGIKLKRFP